MSTYIRIAYHPAITEAGASTHVQFEMPQADVGTGGQSVSAGFEQAPAMVLMVSVALGQSEVVEALAKFPA